jgi:peptidoglycan/LPS O-acetylase OafA/YrhL
MTDYESLYNIADLAISLAGFSGLVAVFRSGSLDDWLPRERFMFWLLLIAALGALFFALLPVALHHYRLREPLVWSISSLLLGIYLGGAIGGAVFAHVRMSRAGHPTSRPTAWLVFPPLGAGFSVSLLLNCAGLGFDRGAGPYYGGLVCLLFTGALMFVFLLTFPAGGRPS